VLLKGFLAVKLLIALFTVVGRGVSWRISQVLLKGILISEIVSHSIQDYHSTNYSRLDCIIAIGTTPHSFDSKWNTTGSIYVCQSTNYSRLDYIIVICITLCYFTSLQSIVLQGVVGQDVVVA
jgi:hypothetical protein